MQLDQGPRCYWFPGNGITNATISTNELLIDLFNSRVQNLGNVRGGVGLSQGATGLKDLRTQGETGAPGPG